MKKNMLISFTIICIITLCGFQYNGNGDKIPDGWFKTGSSPSSYEVGVETGAGMNNDNAVYIKSIDESIKGFGTLMQNFPAKKYLNKRVMLTGYVKSKNVIQMAGLWMRIDDNQNPPKILGFDNMNDRPIKGNSAWKKYSVVLDVPSNSSSINFGILLNGTGEVWLSNLKFEIVDKKVATTDIIKIKTDGPTNLNFEK